MSMTDPISDMLTRIRNASKARKRAVDVPNSNIKREIARILKEEDFIKDTIELPDRRQGILRIYLKYSREDEPIIKGLKRISRPGLRKYYNFDDVKRIVRSQVGLTIMSTSQGIMTDVDALKKQCGGEALCAVW
ncbi:MAG: 30S ribosomal protein S8 [Candidatus Zixiibacteriota bacterium]|nr:MAG: 30S ribosomal protein S8 [candidate division Zixibacteria bacterium]